MQFLTPALLGLTALAAPIIILYMLRLRRREITVSSTMLWQKLLQDREANAPWQKLRRNLLLLLQLLILAALVFGLARPFIPVPSVAAGSVALLIDASASMNATDMGGGKTRLEAAQEQARALVNDLASDEVMTIIAAGPAPDVLTPPTGDRAALRDAINRAKATEASTDWASALALAGASIAGRPNASVVIISDGGLPADLPALTVPVRFLAVGRESSNVAISALATRALGNQPQLFAALTNYGSSDAEVILSLTVDGELHSAERVRVAAGKTTNLTITDLPRSARLIEGQLSLPAQNSTPDFLPTDNFAYAVYAPPAQGKVLLVTQGNVFLEQVLAALPNVEAFRVKPEKTQDSEGTALPDGDYSLVVLDGVLPDTLPETNLLIIDPPRSTDLFSVGEVFDATRMLRQIQDPILSYVDFKDVAIREARQVQTTGWAQLMIEADGGPLLLAGTAGGRRIAILTFDLHASDLPLKITFPILISNLYQWYAPSQPFDAPDGVKPGAPVVIRPQATTTDYRITLPDGSVQNSKVIETSLSFAATAQRGVYSVELLDSGKLQNQSFFAVNLFEPVESHIAPTGSITVGQTAVQGATSGDQFGQRELWPWLAVLAFIVLIIEWWVYHRGSTLPRFGGLDKQKAS